MVTGNSWFCRTIYLPHHLRCSFFSAVVFKILDYTFYLKSVLAAWSSEQPRLWPQPLVASNMASWVSLTPVQRVGLCTLYTLHLGYVPLGRGVTILFTGVHHRFLFSTAFPVLSREPVPYYRVLLSSVNYISCCACSTSPSHTSLKHLSIYTVHRRSKDQVEGLCCIEIYLLIC